VADNIFHTIEWSVVDGIGHLVMAQPPSNRMTLDFFVEMARLRNLLIRTSGLKALIISGKGRHFSSGANLDELLSEISGNPDAERFLKSNYLTLNYFETLPYPVISTIRGVCLGSAVELALFCHYRFCAQDAVLGLPETTFNLIPGIGGIRRFSLLAGEANALDYILSGRTFDAQTALHLGVVDLIVPRQDLKQMAMDFAQWLPEKYNPAMRRVYLERYGKRDTGYEL